MPAADHDDRAAPRADRPLTLAFQSLDYPGDTEVSAIGIYTAMVAEMLVERGHTVHVVSRAPDSDSVREQAGVTVHRVGPPRPPLPLSLRGARATLHGVRSLPIEFAFRRRMARTLHRLVEREAVDMVELADSGAEALFFRPRAHSRATVVMRLHGPTCVHELFDRNVPEAIRRFVRATERRLARAVDRYSVASAEAGAFIATELGLDEERLSILHYPLPFDPRTVPATDPTLEEEDLVVFVGRITPAKGVDRLIEAVPDVLAARPLTRFLLVGPDWPTSTRWPSTTAYLRSRLAPGHAPAVTFTGHVPHADVAGYMRRATVCVFPSVFEVFPLVCLEAMTLGKAIVAGRTGGLRDMLADGEVGVMYDPAAGDDLAALLLRLLADPARRRDLGQRARARALRTYDRERISDAFERFYRDCIRAVRGG